MVISGIGTDTGVKGFVSSVGDSPRKFNFVNDYRICGNEKAEDISDKIISMEIILLFGETAA